MSLLEARDLACGHRGRAVLSNVSFTIEEGERVALLGPNGAGKSTLLATLVGTLRPLAGIVTPSGPPKEMARRIAYVPQEEFPAYPFTAREVVTMGRLAMGDGLHDTPEDREAAETAMREGDCLGLADRPVTELSGGERQRVLIARALAQGTPLLLLDEPTSHLDAPHQVALLGWLAGKTIFAALHDLNLAAAGFPRTILVGNGVVVNDGPTRDVLMSKDLDDLYGMPFDRFEWEGKLRIFPRWIGT
ncbi:ABC transporter ATP-binding protein [soil metagenome]